MVLLSPQRPSATLPDREELQAAFELFSQVSSQLSDSYRALEARILELSEERDLADRQRLRELEEKERISERLQGLLHMLPGGVVVLDARGRVCEANPAARELLGDPLLDVRWCEVIERCFAPRHDDGHELSLRDGRRVAIATRSLEQSGQVILLTDQTETRCLQEKVARQERLALMGRMLAALAHQIRTPLSAAMLYTGHLVRGDLSPEHSARFAAKTMARLQAMEQQVRDMLIFVKGGVHLSERCTVGELAEDLRAALEAPLSAVSGECRLRVGAGAETARLVCNRQALCGAVMNLVNNGLQAGATQLQVEFSNRGGEARQLDIVVADDGAGMDAQTLRRVQDAFYSTKAYGTGLGLAVARAVVHAHQGELELQSTPGRGTRVRLLLPLLPEQAEVHHGA